MLRLLLIILCSFMLLGCNNDNEESSPGEGDDKGPNKKASADSPKYILNNTSDEDQIRLSLKLSQMDAKDSEKKDKPVVSYLLPESSCVTLTKEDFSALIITRLTWFYVLIIRIRST